MQEFNAGATRFTRWLTQPRLGSDYVIGISLGAAAAGADIYHTTIQNWQTKITASEKKVPLLRHQEIIAERQSFIGDVYSAINNSSSAAYIDTVPYDHKQHVPLPDIDSEIANRKLNADFRLYQTTPGRIGHVVTKVANAPSASAANPALLSYSRFLERRDNRLQTQIDKLDNKGGELNRLRLAGDVVGGLVIGGFILSAVTARTREWISRRRLVWQANAVRRQGQKYEDEVVSTQMDNIYNEVEGILRSSDQDDSES